MIGAEETSMGGAEDRAWCYSVAGLELRSEVPLPGLAMGLATTGPPVELRFRPAEQERPEAAGWREWHRSRIVDEDDTALLVLFRRRGDEVLFAYADGHRFRVDAEARRIDVGLLDRAQAAAPGPTARPWSGAIANAVIYLFGPVFAWVLRKRGFLPLHASAITYDGRSVLFMGAAGAGKSTLAASFALAGFPVASDDTAVLVDGGEGALPWVLPDAPRLRLWPSSAELLLPRDGSELEPLTPGWEKLALDLGPASAAGRSFGAFEQQARPLGAIYLLETGEGPLRIEALPPREALLAVVGHGSVSELLDAEMRSAELDLACRWIDRVGEDGHRIVLRRLIRPSGADPDSVRRRIVEDLERQAPSGGRLPGPGTR